MMRQSRSRAGALVACLLPAALVTMLAGAQAPARPDPLVKEGATA